MNKRWEIVSNNKHQITNNKDIISLLLKNRGLRSKKEVQEFINPTNPYDLSTRDVAIDAKSLAGGLKRIQKAIGDKESVVVYADYDADGITAGAIMWETLHALGAQVMPYIPHRTEEGYGLSQKGIDTVIDTYHPSLIITVDHGITAGEKIAYAKKLGVDVIVTDHHVLPKKLPHCQIIHTTTLSGAGVSWFVAKELRSSMNDERLTVYNPELVSLAAIGTIADMMPLIGPNRSIAKYGLAAIRSTKRIGLDALITDAGLTKNMISTYDISHILAPRLNAMGRLVHAMDALRLLCTHDTAKARLLAQKLSLTNRERQQLTRDTTIHAKDMVEGMIKGEEMKKILFIAHDSYNQGVIGLVAGKLVEEYWRPAIVLSQGATISKASARSIPGFDVVNAIRACSDILVDVGGHPMAAGFTIETKYLETLQQRLEGLAQEEIDDDMLTRTLRIDVEIPLGKVTEELWKKIRNLEPFGVGNPEPVFATRDVVVDDARLVGADGKHLKLIVSQSTIVDAIAFGMGELYSSLRPGQHIDVAYTIDMNVWNGSRRLQLKVKDIKV
jgi:single-stranded-DNA-specific exonuclease